jgi:hypothetical protein
MKKLTLKSFFAFFLLFCFSKGFSDNPIVQTKYTADPAPMVYNDRVYLYTSHDDDVTDNNFYTMRDYCCFSTSDMVNWTDHGIVAKLNAFSWLNGHNNDAWAPQCVERNGKFYLYVPIHGKGIGVLEADSPIGPFKDPINKQLLFRDNWSDIDPSVFIDTDGQAYMYWGNGNLWYVKLNENMTSYSGSAVTINPKPNGYTEGPWFYKRDRYYYMIYAGMGGSTENIQYSMSNSATGPWTYKGTIMPSGKCFTNHPGICDFKGNSYFFYHNSNLPGGADFKRSVCVEQFSYNEDGTIPPIEMTKNGPDQVGSINPYDTVQAETMCWEEGIETEPCDEGGMNVSFIENGDYIKVKGVDFSTGADLFEARVASNTDGGKIELYIDELNGTLIGTCTVSGTGGWQKWETKSCTVDNVTDKHDLFLKFSGASGYLFNFNWWTFHKVTGTEAGKLPVRTKLNSLNILSKNANSIQFAYNVPVDFRGNNLKITFSDLKGRLIASQICTKKTSGLVSFEIDRKLLRSGMYVIHICTENNVLFNSSYILH